MKGVRPVQPAVRSAIVLAFFGTASGCAEDPAAPVTPDPIPGAELVHVSADQRYLLYRTDGKAAVGDTTAPRHGGLWLKELPRGPARKLSDDAAVAGVFGDTVLFWTRCYTQCDSQSFNVFRAGMTRPTTVAHAPFLYSSRPGFGPTPGPLGSARAETLLYNDGGAYLLRPATCSDDQCEPIRLDPDPIYLEGRGISPDGRHAVYALAPDGAWPRAPEAWLLSVADMRKIPLPLGGISSVDFSPGGDRVAVALFDPEGKHAPMVVVLRLEDGAPIAWSVPAADRYLEVLFMDDSTLWVRVRQGNDEVIYRTKAGSYNAELLTSANPSDLMLVRDGSARGRIALRNPFPSGGTDRLEYYRLDRDPIVQSVTDYLSTKNSVPLLVSDDGTLVLLLADHYHYGLWRPATGELLQRRFDDGGATFLPGNRALITRALSAMDLPVTPVALSSWDGHDELPLAPAAAAGSAIGRAQPNRLYYTAVDVVSDSETFTVKAIDLP